MILKDILAFGIVVYVVLNCFDLGHHHEHHRPI
ncbi:hypothetical protein GGE12_006248 [Rhizobium mongolense]|uniref:Uncharacterized protein n=1 Tax=Rhizobium mongolense TaxID=57676 RepID=A0A7W6WHE0_9HYPH|nr:hypothetical protein [Rhizobium mongolense]